MGCTIWCARKCLDVAEAFEHVRHRINTTDTGWIDVTVIERHAKGERRLPVTLSTAHISSVVDWDDLKESQAH